MLLLYARRGRSIRVSRWPAAAERKGTAIAVIDLRAFKVRILDGIAASPEESREIEEAARELATAGAEKRAATLGYSESAAGAMKYYLEKASDLDKQLIVGTVRATLKTLRRAQPPKPRAAATEQKQGGVPASPEVVAEAIYKALSENSEGKVKGEPGAAKRTEVRGFWDLREVARKILSKA